MSNVVVIKEQELLDFPAITVTQEQINHFLIDECKGQKPSEIQNRIKYLRFLKECGKIIGDFRVPSVDEVLKHEGQ